MTSPRSELHPEVERASGDLERLREEVDAARAELRSVKTRLGTYQPLELGFVRVATVAAVLLTVLQVLVSFAVERAAVHVARDVSSAHARTLLRVDLAERMADVEDACFKGQAPERATASLVVDGAGELRRFEWLSETRVKAACAETVIRYGGLPRIPPTGAEVVVETVFLPPRPVR